MQENMPLKDDHGESLVGTPDPDNERRIRLVLIGIAACVVLMLTVVLYGLLSGVINPPAPRTASEYALARAKEMMVKEPKNGQYWGDYIDLLVARGSLSEAQQAVAQARKAVGADDTGLIVNNSELRLLIARKQYQKAFDLSTKYMKADEDQRNKRNSELAARGIKAPDSLNAARQDLTVELMSLRAIAAVEIKNYDDGIRALTIALRADPEAADVAAFRGKVLMLKGDKQSLEFAKSDFERALKFIPDYQPALDALKELKTKVPKASTTPTKTK
jgi:tetratricopeptide (TPR) repeat protein